MKPHLLGPIAASLVTLGASQSSANAPRPHTDAANRALEAALISARQAGADAAYSIKPGPGLPRAIGPRNHVEASFGETGPTLPSAGARPLTLSLVEARCNDVPLALSRTSTPRIAGNRVEYDITLGASSAIEWYVHGPLGIEQGFTLQQGTCTGRISLDLDVGGLTPRPDERDIVLLDDRGRPVFGYGFLYAYDGDEAPLPSTLTPRAHSLTISVDVDHARFPVVIDPLLWRKQVTIPPPGGPANSSFGQALALSGDTAIIGAPNLIENNYDVGIAYVFTRNQGLWSLQATFLHGGVVDNTPGQPFPKPLIKQPGDLFGTAVALDGEQALVGAPFEGPAAIGPGAAYLLARTGTTWQVSQKFLPSDLLVEGFFGAKVQLQGATAVIVDTSSQSGPPIYVHHDGPSGWQLQARLPGADAPSSAPAMGPVALDGDVLVAGSRTESTAATNAGAALVFVRNAGVWSFSQLLTAPTPIAQGSFGSAVALSNGTLLVGEPGNSTKAQFAGAVHVFTLNGSTFDHKQVVYGSHTDANHTFGSEVAISGDTAAVGAQSHGSYVLGRVANSWVEQAWWPGAGRAVAAQPLDVLLSNATVYHLSLDNGEPCAVAASCLFACVDSVCCDGACDGPCDACSIAAGAASDGTCGPVAPGSPGAPACGATVCDGVGSACPTSCASDDGCAADHYCDLSATCAPRLAQGTPCGLSCHLEGCRDCESGHCVDGVCCDTSCDDPCAVCATSLGATSPGACSPAPAGASPTSGCLAICDGASRGCPPGCASDDDCTADAYCDQTGTCAPRRGQGDPCDPSTLCTTPGCRICLSEHCVDSVCCDEACDGACEVCGPGGLCGAAPLGTEPSAPCGAFACGGDTRGCPSQCSSDLGCAPGFHCTQTGACAPQKAIGQPCSDSDCGAPPCNLCESGHCVDGFCCDTPCTGACETCAMATGAKANGACGPAAEASQGHGCAPPFACNGNDAACPSSCSTDADCEAERYCDKNGACQKRRTIGAACSDEKGADCLQTGCRVCQSGTCADGFCCDAPCAGACDACSAARGATANGHCTVLAAGDPGTPPCGALGACDGVDPQCPGGCTETAGCDFAKSFCDQLTHECAPRKTLGDPCASDDQCLPSGNETKGHCVDSVCCDTSCDGRCEACAASTKQAGSDGTCGAALEGTNPRDLCKPHDLSTPCGEIATCTANRACAFEPTSRPCEGGSCSGALLNARFCDGAGACSETTKTLDCAPYACAPQGCRSPCQSDVDCSQGNRCQPDGACTPGKPPGQPCVGADECESGFCTDGVCCATSCSGQCESCAQKGSEGACKATPKGEQPSGDRKRCDDGPDAECHGSCDGGDRSACRYPGQSTLCASTRCDNDTLSPAVCDGQGTCVAQPPRSCGDYSCKSDGSGCNTECATGADCKAGRVCDMSKRQCATASGTCKDAFTVEKPDGTETPCSPYRCSNGSCRDSCAAAADCADGYTCKGGVCEQGSAGAPGAQGGGGQAAGQQPAQGGAAGSVAATPPAAETPAEEGGCGCLTVPARSEGRAALALGLALTAIARRRRQGAARPCR